MVWQVVLLDQGVRAAVDALPVDIRAKFLRITQLKGRDGIARAAYVTASGQRVVVVHVFEKKTQKTPRREIELALRRAKEVE